ncbi:MAG: multiheme c-type cytochrome [Candidatus Promineifilaceae bacterium]|nr:multiheme c-type cytochrome [Candidatus Promineifilaceae bacterium]
MSSTGVKLSRISTVVASIVLSIIMISLVTLLFSQPEQGTASAKMMSDISQLDPLVASTPRDFILPGTQPNNLIHQIVPPDSCANCHAYYADVTGQPQESETWRAWSGSMMSQAGRDPVFFAALDIANADAASSGEFCLRCHIPRGWLDGRSEATDGSQMTAEDREGVQCAVCHRMVDPVYTDENPPRDIEILAGLNAPVSFIGSGSIVVDPLDHRRGPFDIVAELGGDFDPHKAWGAEDTLVSPYHQEASFCGTCHDINNPMFTWDEVSQEYQPNPLDQAGDPVGGFPIERTYSEWQLSAFNSEQGIFAPQFGGNKKYVSICQDCHMRDITGTGGAFFGGTYILRNDMPLHDLTGANTWVPQIIVNHPVFSATFNGDPERKNALMAGIDRARYMLQNAASLDVFHQDNKLSVTVFNQSGHKLPSGYVEGRRMWLQIEGFNAAGELIYTSGAYDEQTGILKGYHSDPVLKVYEAEQGLTESWAAQLGLPAGPSFHFVLNNQVVHDNRIPPKGYQFEAFEGAGAAPYTDGVADPDIYADGQSWDTTVYELPEDVAYGVVRLLYQTASKEYIEFLRDNNPYAGNNNGEILYDLWTKSGRSQPELMVERPFSANTQRQFLPSIQRP